MNVIVANEKQNELSKLDIDIIKNTTGVFESSVLVEMYKTFFFNKMVLDVTALKNYKNIDTYKELIRGLEAEKIIFYIPENTSLCTANFLASLINIGIYNFTTNLDGVKYLIKHSNSLKDVEHILTIASQQPIVPAPITTEEKSSTEDFVINTDSTVGPKIIGVKNLTRQCGATTFIYMLKNELEDIFGKNSILAIEIDRNDFSVFSNKEMISATKDTVRGIIRKSMNYRIILIDLNDFPDESICSDIYYLLEPSIIKLNKLMRRNRNIFQVISGRKLVLNQSLLSEKDVSDFEYEAKTSVFYNMPPLDERKNNEAMYNFIIKSGLVTVEKKDNQNKVFGLFRR